MREIIHSELYLEKSCPILISPVHTWICALNGHKFLKVLPDWALQGAITDLHKQGGLKCLILILSQFMRLEGWHQSVLRAQFSLNLQGETSSFWNCWGLPSMLVILHLQLHFPILTFVIMLYSHKALLTIKKNLTWQSLYKESSRIGLGNLSTPVWSHHNQLHLRTMFPIISHTTILRVIRFLHLLFV